MGFFRRIRSGKLFFGKKEPTLIGAFIFKGKRYILEEFDLEFKQELDDKNRPNSEVKGGLLFLTISETPERYLTAWMMNSFEKRDGEIRFFVNEGKLAEGSVLDISFKDAYCISYQTSLNPVGAGSLTTFIVSAKLINIGNQTYINDNWRG